MPKAYWVTMYRSVSDQSKVDAYAKLAGPAIEGNGGRFIARGNAQKAYEAGVTRRCVIIEFDSVDAAVKAHDSEAYQAALRALDNGAERDIRFIEGVG